MKIFVTLFAVLLSVIPGKAYAQQMCTQMGCMNGLMLDVDPDYQWKWGFYEFEFRLPGRTISCKGSLPLKKCDDGPSFKCSSDMIMIGESGCALPESSHSISTIQIDGTPRRLMVIVKRGGKTIITRTLNPEYKENQPNGPGCGPVCTSASYNLLTAE